MLSTHLESDLLNLVCPNHVGQVIIVQEFDQCVTAEEVSRVSPCVFDESIIFLKAFDLFSVDSQDAEKCRRLDDESRNRKNRVNRTVNFNEPIYLGDDLRPVPSILKDSNPTFESNVTIQTMEIETLKFY